MSDSEKYKLLLALLLVEFIDQRSLAVTKILLMKTTVWPLVGACLLIVSYFNDSILRNSSKQSLGLDIESLQNQLYPYISEPPANHARELQSSSPSKPSYGLKFKLRIIRALSYLQFSPLSIFTLH